MQKFPEDWIQKDYSFVWSMYYDLIKLTDVYKRQVKGPKKAEPAADISTKPDIKKAQLQEDKEPENDAAVSSKAEKKHKEHKKKKPKAVNA